MTLPAQLSQKPSGLVRVSGLAQKPAITFDDGVGADDQPLPHPSCHLSRFSKGEGLGPRDPNELYEVAVNWIEARRLERHLEQLDEQLPFESPERQMSLLAEKRRVFDELRKRYPRYKIAGRRRRGAPGT